MSADVAYLGNVKITGRTCMYHVGALGTDFRSASLRMRDALYLEKERISQFIDSIPEDAPIREVVAISTCNRIEIFYACADHDRASTWLRSFLADFHQIPVEMIEKVMQEYRCKDAVRHLFRIVSGAESMVFGETEILGQVRQAYFYSMKNAATDSYLNRLFQQAIATGKKVRSQTSVGRGAVSIASVAIEQMIELVGRLDNKNILIIGLGTMGLRALKRLHTEDYGKLTLCNRTEERAMQFAKQYNAEQISFGDWKEQIFAFDIVLFATSYTGQSLLTKFDIQKALLPANKKLLVVDLGAPRNVEKEIECYPGISLICVDDLKEIAEQRMEERKHELGAITKIVDEQVSEFSRWYGFKREIETSIEMS